MRVMFVHGLESGPSGTKVRVLREQGFDVVAEDMHMSLRRWDKRNSVLRSLLRGPELWAWVLGTLGLVVGAWWLPPLLLVAAAVALGGVVGRGRAWVQQAMATSLVRCAEIQRRALIAHAPDVVVGSSWGGAVVVQLLLDGSWSGPTVLLAPAHRLVQQRTNPAGVEAHQAQIRALDVALVTVHDPGEEVVPYVADDAIHEVGETVLAAGAGHRLLPCLEDGTVARAIRKVGPEGR